MEKNTIDSEYQQLCQLAMDDRLSEAIAQMRQMLDGTDDHELASAIATLHDEYCQLQDDMLMFGYDRYAQRRHAALQARVLNASSSVARDKMLRGGFNLYAMCHSESRQNEDDEQTVGLMEELVIQAAGCTSHDDRYFWLHDSLWNCIYTSAPLPDDDARVALEALLGSLDTPMQAYMISALTLGVYTFFCPHKYVILCHTAKQSDDAEVKARALVGVMLVTNRYAHLFDAYKGAGLNLTNEMSQARAENRNLLSPLFEAWIMATSTGTLQDTLEKKLLPLFMGSKKVQTRNFTFSGQKASVIKIDATNPLVFKNPKERNAIMSFIGLLKGGADTNYATFAPMKRFDFFMTMAHWVMPFTPEHPLIRRVAGQHSNHFAGSVAMGMSLCSSDMFSMSSMLGLTSGMAREKLFSTVANHGSLFEQLDPEEREEALSQMMAEEKSTPRRIKAYMQDLYRLFTLHPAKDEMGNPFAAAEQKVGQAAFWRITSGRLEFLLGGADFYNEIGRTQDAIDFYRKYLKSVPDDADAMMRLGDCLIRTEAYRQAAETYRHALLAGADEVECLKHLAVCLRASRNYSALVDVIERLTQLLPDDKQVPNSMASALLKAERFDEAYDIFRSIELDDEQDETARSQAARGAAWCQICMGQYDDALLCYDRYMDQGTLLPEDLLNRAHALWGLGRTQEAADCYLSHLRLYSASGGEDEPFKIFDEDAPDVVKHIGKTWDEVHIMRDYLMRNIKNT